MSESADDQDSDAESVTDGRHENSWSANLELPPHADDPELVVSQAIDAIENAAPGYHVNLVTNGDLGHPETDLYERLQATYTDREVDWESVEQCGCGGHGTRVHVDSS